MVESEFDVPSGLYVDVENLGNDGAGQLIDDLLEAWPDFAPKPTKINLYVKGDTTSLWRIRFLNRAHTLEKSVKGVQHFNSHGSKNSADIAIAIDAIADFAYANVRHISVFSDDSDFMSLFDKISELAQDELAFNKRLPFLWVLTNRAGGKSPRIKEFIPAEYLHYVGELPRVSESKPDSISNVSISPSKNVGKSKVEQEVVACIIKELPLGKFKIAACQHIISKEFPAHPMAKIDSAKFGSWFANNIWPLMKKRGVQLIKAKSPRTYEITQAAKESITVN